jgi:uncharacterized protein YfaS (alpha-2-macroglobulin family)
MEKWHEVVEKKLASGDEMLKEYPGKLDGEEGHLAVSKERVVFVTEKGFLSKTYNVTLDIPHRRIGKIERTKNYEVELTDDEGTIHKFSTVLTVIPAANIEKSLKEFT